MRGCDRRGIAFQRALADGLTASMVTHQVERDRINPCLLARFAAVEARAGAEYPLKGVGDDVLGQTAIPRPVDEEPP